MAVTPCSVPNIFGLGLFGVFTVSTPPPGLCVAFADQTDTRSCSELGSHPVVFYSRVLSAVAEVRPDSCKPPTADVGLCSPPRGRKGFV